ncbi:sialin-like [Ornithodoros turicata]|uniref:sialin-like n=1 Tax=Ornithodoros turicata TaxID=34597 RepID=UPI003138D0E2
MVEMRLAKYNYLMYLGEASSFPRLPLVLVLGAVVVTSGVASDFLRDKGHLSTATLRKVFCSGALLLHGGTVMLLGLKHSIWLSHLSTAALGVFVLGVECNHIDLAPQHAPVLKSISSTLQWLVIGLLSMFFLSDDTNIMSHRVAHVILPVCQMGAAMLYLLYGEGERQDWDLPVVPLDMHTTPAKDIETAHSDARSEISDPLPCCSQENIADIERERHK